MTRVAVEITAGVRKAQRFPVSQKRKPGQPAHRPVDNNRLTRNERAYYDACLQAWDSISDETIRAQFLFPASRESGDEIRNDLAEIQPFLSELTLYQFEQSGALVFNEIKQQVSAEWERLEKAITDTPSEFAASMQFNRASPAAVSYAELSAANMVTDMVDTQVTAIRGVIARGYRQGLGRGVVESRLVTLLNEMPSPQKIPAGLGGMGTIFGDATRGLTDRYALAVFNRAEQIMRDNPTMQPRELKRRVDNYGKKLRRSRARMIARTEMMRASNQGRLQGMYQAADRGLVNPALARKQWVTSAFDVCPICVPLNGRTIGIRESFGPEGQAPPAHPNCRCTIRMLPDPNTFGLPTTAGTGQFPDAPMRFIRPERPGLKIEDLPDVPGVVGQPQPLIGQPGARSQPLGVPEPLGEVPITSPTPTTPATRIGNVGSEVRNAEKATKRSRAVIDPVVEQMDDAGIVMGAMEDGVTEISLTQSAKAQGSFNPRTVTQSPKLRTPKGEQPNSFSQNPDGSYKYGSLDEKRRFSQTEADRDRYLADLDAWYKEKEALEASYYERMDEWMNAGGVPRPRIKVANSYNSPTGKVKLGEASQRNTLVHEIGHRIDYSDSAGFSYNTRSLVAKVERDFDLPTSGNIYDVDALDLPESDRNVWRFLQAAFNSDSLDRARRNIRGSFKSAEAAEEYIAYISEPVELWARSFNQWFTMRYGDADMIADMVKTAEEGFGYQWRLLEFDEEIAPLVENVLRGWGAIQ